MLAARAALVFFAKYALCLNCFRAVVCFVENCAAVVAKQNFEAVTIHTPADVLIYRFQRVIPYMKSVQKRTQRMTTANNHLPLVLMGSSWLFYAAAGGVWAKKKPQR
jgi:hypothetical protein